MSSTTACTRSLTTSFSTASFPEKKWLGAMGLNSIRLLLLRRCFASCAAFPLRVLHINPQPYAQPKPPGSASGGASLFVMTTLGFLGLFAGTSPVEVFPVHAKNPNPKSPVLLASRTRFCEGCATAPVTSGGVSSGSSSKVRSTPKLRAIPFTTSAIGRASGYGA